MAGHKHTNKTPTLVFPCGVRRTKSLLKLTFEQEFNWCRDGSDETRKNEECISFERDEALLGDKLRLMVMTGRVGTENYPELNLVCGTFLRQVNVIFKRVVHSKLKPHTFPSHHFASGSTDDNS